nr:uncharacterized protein LOC119184678 isoform X2 [Rhipicephalus microplus]
MSAPASLSCSSEDLHRLAELSIHGGAAGDALASTPSWTPGHRRVGSAGSQQCNVPSASGDQGATPTSWASGRRTSGHPHPSVHPAALSRPDPSRKTSWPATPDCPQEVDLGLNAHLLIEPALQPLSPVPSCQESVRIFDDHRCLAQWYFKLQSEICLLNQRRTRPLILLLMAWGQSWHRKKLLEKNGQQPVRRKSSQPRRRITVNWIKQHSVSCLLS